MQSCFSDSSKALAKCPIAGLALHLQGDQQLAEVIVGILYWSVCFDATIVPPIKCTDLSVFLLILEAKY